MSKDNVFVSPNLYEAILKDYQPIYCQPELAVYINTLIKNFVDIEMPDFPINKDNGLFLCNRKIIREIIKIYSIDTQTYKKIKDENGHTSSVIYTTNELFKFISKDFRGGPINEFIKVKNLMSFVENFAITYYVSDDQKLLDNLDILLNYTKKIKIFRYNFGQGYIYRKNIDYNKILDSWDIPNMEIKMLDILQKIEDENNGFISQN